MRAYAKPIDVSTNTELRRLAEQVQATRLPVPLTWGDEIIAVVQPAPKKSRAASKLPSAADLAATMSSAGSWADVDAETLKRQIKEGRSDHRPPVEL